MNRVEQIYGKTEERVGKRNPKGSLKGFHDVLFLKTHKSDKEKSPIRAFLGAAAVEKIYDNG